MALPPKLKLNPETPVSPVCSSLWAAKGEFTSCMVQVLVEKVAGRERVHGPQAVGIQMLMVVLIQPG